MPFEQYLFSMLVGVILCVIIFELVRLRKLKEEFSVLWIAIGVGVILLANGYDTLVDITYMIGATTSTTVVFILAILVLLAMNLHFSIRISAMTTNIKNLTQELAIIQAKKSSTLVQKEKQQESRIIKNVTEEDG